MAFRFLPDHIALANGASMPIGAAGGNEPYTFEIVSGGGILQAGVFTAPEIGLGNTTLRVTDSDGVSVDQIAHVLTPLQLICDVIQQGMGLADGRVYLWDQKIFSPTDPGLWVAVSQLSSKFISNSNTFDPVMGQMQSSVIRSTLGIDLVSRDTSARDQQGRFLFALTSQYSQNQQGRNAFRIFPICTQFLNISEIDGAAIPYRFHADLQVQYQLLQSSDVPFYDNFSQPSVSIDP